MGKRRRNGNICFNCFFDTHRASERTSHICLRNTCKKKHHSLLHYEHKTANAVGIDDSDSGEEESDYVGGAATITAPADPTATVITESATTVSPDNGENATAPLLGTSTQGDKQALPVRTSGVYMSTILVPIKKPDGTTASIRAMLDTGAECNVLSEEVAKRINADIQPTTRRIFGVGGANGPSVQGKTDYASQGRPR